MGMLLLLCASHCQRMLLFLSVRNTCNAPAHQDQLQSDNVLEDVACMLGCTRSSLHGEPYAALSLLPGSSGTLARRFRGHGMSRLHWRCGDLWVLLTLPSAPLCCSGGVGEGCGGGAVDVSGGRRPHQLPAHGRRRESCPSQ